jgi:phosphohistidine phosphatase
VRRLVLIRHAKAAVGDLDRRRPLTPEGMTAAEGIGRYLADNGPAPDRIVTSPARRAAETWAAAAQALTNPPEPDEDERVYDNTIDSLQDMVRDTPPDVGTLVVVGHNPSIRDFAHATDDGTGDPDLRKILADRFPTAAVAVFDIREDWATLDQGTLSGLHLRSLT